VLIKEKICSGIKVVVNCFLSTYVLKQSRDVCFDYKFDFKMV